MKIAMIIKSFGKTGVCMSVANIAATLRKLGHSVVVIAGDGPSRTLVEKSDIPVILAPVDKFVTGWFLAYWKLRKWLQEWEVDIIHTHFRTANIVGAMLAKRLGVPHVSTLHLQPIPDDWLRVKFSFWGDRVIAIASENIEYLNERFGVQRERIALIPHGIDCNRFKPIGCEERARVREQFGFSKDDLLIVTMGRLVANKGYQLLIEAMSRIHKQYPRLRLLICGEGPCRDELEQLVQKLSVKEKVVMPGWIDTTKIMPAGDIFALPSHVEGFGLVSVESGLCGLPSIRTATVGAADIVVPGVTGQIVPVGDTSQDFIKHTGRNVPFWFSLVQLCTCHRFIVSRD